MTGQSWACFERHGHVVIVRQQPSIVLGHVARGDRFESPQLGQIVVKQRREPGHAAGIKVGVGCEMDGTAHREDVLGWNLGRLGLGFGGGSY